MKDRLRLLKLLKLAIGNCHSDVLKEIIQWLIEIEEDEIEYKEMKNSLMKNSSEKFTR